MQSTSPAEMARTSEIAHAPTQGTNNMASMIIWFTLITVSLSAMIIAAGAGTPVLHMVMTAVISIGIALVAVFENSKLRSEGAAKSVIAASTARSMGFVYVWGALAIAVTYLYILQWHEWWHFLTAFAVAATLCLFYSNMLTRDAEAGRVDAPMLNLGRILTWVQLVGMGIAMIGMLIDGKLSRYHNPKHMDWAAQNIFFFGALALALISAYALWVGRNDGKDGGA
jgi:hypothetical protein